VECWRSGATQILPDSRWHERFADRFRVGRDGGWRIRRRTHGSLSTANALNAPAGDWELTSGSPVVLADDAAEYVAQADLTGARLVKAGGGVAS
jgi:hypothetical protein